MYKSFLTKICLGLGAFLIPLSTFAITQRVNVTSNGEETSGQATPKVISQDGRFVLFYSYISNLVPDDTNGEQDVFVRDTLNNTTERVSIGNDGSESNDQSFPIAISSGGRYVYFYSSADNLVADDTNGQIDIFMRDRINNTTTRVTVDSNENESNGYSEGTTATSDGRYVLFYSEADNLVTDDTNWQGDVFVRDMVNGTTERINVSSSGVESNGYTIGLAISSDGRYVLFHSYADNLVADDTNGQGDVFVRDIVNGTTERVSISSDELEGNGYTIGISITSDGRYVLFYSESDNLVADDTNSQGDIFVRDRTNGTTMRVSISTEGYEGNASVVGKGISSDGRYVLFSSDADTLVADDTNGQGDVFIRDMINNTTKRINVSSSGEQGNGYSDAISMSQDGKYIFFVSDADNLVADDTNDTTDIFVRDMDLEITTRISVNSVGDEANEYSELYDVTNDGKYILFNSSASNLVSDDTNGEQDIFVNERQIVFGLAPIIVSPTSGYSSNNTGDIVVEGYGTPGNDVRIRFLNNDFFAVVGNDGEWSSILPWQLDGEYTIYAQQKQSGDSLWSLTGLTVFRIDTIKPVLPVITSPLENSYISGGTLYVYGTGEMNGSVNVRVGKQLKQVVIDSTGDWAAGPYYILPGYKYGITAQQIDSAGNKSAWSSVKTIYGVPQGTVTINPNDYVSDLVLYKKGQTQSGSTTLVNPLDTVSYTLQFANAGNAYASGVSIIEAVPVNTCFEVGSVAGLGDDYTVSYSNNAGVTYTYLPIGITGAVDCAVTHIKIENPSVMASEQGGILLADVLTGDKEIVSGDAASGVFFDNFFPTFTGFFPEYNDIFNYFRLGVSDLNEDGRDDIIALNAGFPIGNSYIYFANTGGFSLYQLPGGVGRYIKPLIGDFNQDGKTDIVGGGFNGQSTSKIYFNNGNDTFTTYVLSGGNNIYMSLLSTDVNADGLVDIVGAGWGTPVRVYPNLGSGQFGMYALPGGIRYFQNFESIDINKDGALDFFGMAGGLVYYMNSGTGGFVVNTIPATYSASSYATGDFNQDGYIDIVSVEYAGPGKIYLNSTTGYSLANTFPTLSGTDTKVIKVSDMDNDGRTDIVVVGNNYLSTIFYNTTTGFVETQIGNSLRNITSLELFDIDNNGFTDVFAAGYLSDIILNSGNRVFTNNDPLALSIDPYMYSIVDIDNDTFKDIVVGSEVWLNDGGKFILNKNDLSSSEGKLLDRNADGIKDIVGIYSSQITVYKGLPKVGRYTTVVTSTGGLQWDKIYVQQETTANRNEIRYSFYPTSGMLCDLGGDAYSSGQLANEFGMIDISHIDNDIQSICIVVDFKILTGWSTPILHSLITTWLPNNPEGFRFNVKVKGSGFSGTTVVNVANILSTTADANTGNNRAIYTLTGLPVPVVIPPSVGAFGGGGGSVTPIVSVPKKEVIAKTPQQLADIVAEIREIDISKPEKPVIETLRPSAPVGPVTTVEIKPTTPNIAIKEAIVQTSYVSVGSTVEVKTVVNPVLKSEQKCYTPKEIVDITLGKNATNKDLLVYQALLKSYDLTMFSDTDSYKPENGLKRYEAAKMFTNFAKHVLCREAVVQYENNYTDIENVDETLKPYIIQAYEYGILKGSNGQFRPLERISRKEFVAALIRMFTNTNMDIENAGNEWDANYQEAFKTYGLEKIVGVDEEVDRYDMSKIMYKLYYNTSYEWTEKGYVLPYGRD